MSTSLLRMSDISSDLGTEEASDLYHMAFLAAHSHPRKYGRLKAIFRKLRNMAIADGIWERHKR